MGCARRAVCLALCDVTTESALDRLLSGLRDEGSLAGPGAWA